MKSCINMISIRNWILAIAFVASAGGALLMVATPQTAAAATKCNDGFLGFPAWYRGLTNADCDIKSPDGKNDNPTLTEFIWHIVLNILEMALVAVGYLSGFFILFGGFLFISSQGKPEGAAKARLTILYAVIGLAVSLVAVAIVNLVFNGVLK